MSMLSRDELKTLMQANGGPCMSLFMPTFRTRPDNQQNHIIFKNLMRQAEDQLKANGMRRAKLEQFLTPMKDWLQDGPFWWHQSEGFAVFRSKDVFRSYRLPISMDELLVIADTFHVKPLLPVFSGDGRFFVLALSQSGVRLLQCTRESVSEVSLPGVPKSLDEALRYVDPQRQLQFHTGATARGGERAAMFFGHGAGADEAENKKDVLEFCHSVNRGLHRHLRNERAPLVLAGVEYIHPLYREANDYPHLLPEGIKGNPEATPVEQLHDRAWSIVEPYFRRVREEAMARFEQEEGTRSGLSSTELTKIVPAAHDGQVELLFVADGMQKWGAFKADTREVFQHESARPGDEDLLNLAAVQTLLHGGVVYPVEPNQVPGGPAAALLRYPMR